MADNEKRVSTGVAQEIPLDPLPPAQHQHHQHNVASDSSSEFDEVSLVTLPCLALRYLLHLDMHLLRIN
jgi:hypothetical protein